MSTGKGFWGKGAARKKLRAAFRGWVVQEVVARDGIEPPTAALFRDAGESCALRAKPPRGLFIDRN